MIVPGEGDHPRALAAKRAAVAEAAKSAWVTEGVVAEHDGKLGTVGWVDRWRNGTVKTAELVFTDGTRSRYVTARALSQRSDIESLEMKFISGHVGRFHPVSHEEMDAMMVRTSRPHAAARACPTFSPLPKSRWRATDRAGCALVQLGGWNLS